MCYLPSPLKKSVTLPQKMRLATCLYHRPAKHSYLMTVDCKGLVKLLFCF